MNAQMQLPSSDDKTRLRDFFKGHFKAAFEESGLTVVDYRAADGAVSCCWHNAQGMPERELYYAPCLVDAR